MASLFSMAARVPRALMTLGPKKTLKLIRKKLAGNGGSTGQPLQIPQGILQQIDWTQPTHFANPRLVVEDRPLDIAWVTSPPSPGSGGHQNIFRFVRALEDAGHRCTLYFWDWQGARVNGEHLRKMLAPVSAYPDLKAEFLPYDGVVHESADMLIATAWETAFPVFLDPSRAKRGYFVQDFEPLFYPTGDNSVLAENTYRFGFHGFTAGGWLAQKLSNDFGMDCDSYDFSADTERYFVADAQDPRKDIFFYARPTTPRRAFDLGIATLSLVKYKRPDITIHFAGYDIDPGLVPFDFVNHASMDLTALNELYNKCGSALVLSLTNMSLLPLELLAAGVTPVVNDGPNNRLVSDNPNINYQPLAIPRLANALIESLDAASDPEEVRKRSASVEGHTWQDSAHQFVQAVERALRG